ncbi:preprotein translocase subunit YajC [Pseudonocardia sp. HH130630-07]|uniref:preprotein translocase subunit YajC n=1 Tax=Pseudonocardia sp. HH130630-07 TaxID=1690815 RepID=UPI0008152F65|nr:preprotein translocase subunit YajC [Pseudonocardia sp. HH130630-07]ANY09537.1 hypothetical protein AFB00_28560 [Pseudonocardia sp. HH130630-07]
MDLILAQEAGGSSLFSLFPFALILLLFIPLFLNGRKQRRQMAETQSMQQALEDGDVVVTTSGLRATVVDASYEDTLDLEIADGVVTTWLRAAIREKVVSDETAEVQVEPEKAEQPEQSENKPTIH